MVDRNFEERFLAELRHHLAGWKAKVLEDFSEASCKSELDSLAQDPVYAKFHLHSPEYVLIRLMGRMSISIGRRLGEIYDKLPRLVAQARYGLSKTQVAPKMGGKLELDICIPFDALKGSDVTAVQAIAERYLDVPVHDGGLGIEIRYNFNPNDSARLRKDVKMAQYLRARGLLPVYLIFAENSPRDEAIERLRRAGWTFLIGRTALEFISVLIGEDIDGVLKRPKVAAEIKEQIDEMISQMLDSFAFRSVLSRRFIAAQQTR